MLVAFFDRDSDELTPNRKGALFEALARRLSEEAGYTDVVLRAKHSSLEYDIEGRSVLHGVRLSGEAKAHEANIPGQVVSAFVGKLMPLAAQGRVDGLFISTSSFTAEARDYLETTVPTLSTFNIEMTTLVGGEIPQFFADHGGYASDALLKSRVQELHGLELLDTWLVSTDSGDFQAAACGPNNVAAATGFALRTLQDGWLRANARRRTRPPVAATTLGPDCLNAAHHVVGANCRDSPRRATAFGCRGRGVIRLPVPVPT
jgi:hypothetical protein